MDGQSERLVFRAVQGGDWLYDCHSAQFRALRRGGVTAASGFLPLFVSQLFGVNVRDWSRLLQLAFDELAVRGVAEQEAWLRGHAPVMSVESAAEIAFLAYPEMEILVHRGVGEREPFALDDRYVLQDNVELAALSARRDGRWVPIWERSESEPASARGAVLALCQPGIRTAPVPPPPGLYVTGHSGLLLRGEAGGIAIDPVLMGPLAGRRPLPIAALRRAVTAVGLTHGHFDHYHLPTLLALSDLPLLVKQVPSASIVCEDIARRLEEFGAPQVLRTEWGDRLEIDDLVVHVLPFVGEQFLVNESHPGVRSWGQCYVIETAGRRVMVLADCGFERDRDVFEVVEAWVSAHGPVDVVVCQSIALRPSFAQGDPDLQLTGLLVPHRAVDALRLQRPQERVTLAVEDLPRLCHVTGASVLVPHGQFGFDVGSPAIGAALLGNIRGVMGARCPDVRVEPIPVGAGLRASDLSPVTWLASE